MIWRRITAGALIGLAIFGASIVQATGSGDSGAISFSREIAPILAAKCEACHGAKEAKGKYRVDTYNHFLGEDIVVPGDPDFSFIMDLLLIEDEGERMPQKDDPLPPEQIELIRAWIAQGAPYDAAAPDEPLSAIIPEPPAPEPPEAYPHPLPVAALAYDPASEAFVTGGFHELLFWEKETGKLLKRLRGAPEKTMAICTGGEWLAAAGGSPGRRGSVVLWRKGGDQPALKLKGFPDMVMAAAFSADGGRLAVGGADNIIRIYKLPGTEPERVIAQHADWVLDLAFSEDGERLASASRDHTARVFDAKTGALHSAFRTHGAPVLSVAFTPDGERAISGDVNGRMFSWNAEKGDGEKRLDGAGAVYALITGGDRMFRGSGNGEVRQYALPSGDHKQRFDGQKDWVISLAFDGENHLAAGSQDGRLTIWKLDTLRKPAVDVTSTPGFAPAPVIADGPSGQ